MANETSTKKQLSATVYYLLVGQAVGWPGLLGTGLVLPEWAIGDVTSPLSLALIHLLILGSMLTIALGVLYQIVPIAFQGPPVHRHVLYWHLPLHLLSVGAMVGGFLIGRLQLVAVGGTVLTAATLAFLWQIARSYQRARNKTPVHRGLLLPFVGLLFVLAIGLVQATFPSAVTQRLLLTHALLGGLAFWGGLVLVISYKLIPMFIISQGARKSVARAVVPYFAGLTLILLGLWTSGASKALDVTGSGAILFGLLIFTYDVGVVVRNRKHRLVLPMVAALWGTGCFVLGQLGVLMAIAFQTSRWLYPSVYLFAFGGLVALMLAYAQKMVPFLWFEYRFSKRPERKSAPLMDDMVPKRAAQFGMTLYFVGIASGSAGLMMNLATPIGSCLDWISAGALTIGSIVVFLSLLHVLSIGGQRPSTPDAS